MNFIVFELQTRTKLECIMDIQIEGRSQERCDPVGDDCLQVKVQNR